MRDGLVGLRSRRGPQYAVERDVPPVFQQFPPHSAGPADFSDPTVIGSGHQPHPLRMRARSAEPVPPPTAAFARGYTQSMSVAYGTPASAASGHSPTSHQARLAPGDRLPPPTTIHPHLAHPHTKPAPRRPLIPKHLLYPLLLVAALFAVHTYDPCLFPIYDRVDPDALHTHGAAWASPCDFTRDVTAYRRLLTQLLVREYAESAQTPADLAAGLDLHTLKERTDKQSVANGWPKLTYRPAHNRFNEAIEISKRHRVVKVDTNGRGSVVRLTRAPSIFSLDVLRVYDAESTALLLGSAMMAFVWWTGIAAVAAAVGFVVYWRCAMWHKHRTFQQTVIATAKRHLREEMRRAVELHALLQQELAPRYTLSLQEFERLIDEDPSIEARLGSLEGNTEYLALAE